MEICESLSSSTSSSSSDEIHQLMLRNAKYTYSRHDLISLGKLKHCRNIPNGFITSNLKELGIASSCMQDLFYGENRQGLLPSPEDGLYGRRSNSLSSRSKENKYVLGEVISGANDCCQLKKSANPYRPPHSRTKTDNSSSSQEASSGTGSDCDNNSIIFYELVEDQQKRENQSQPDEDDEDWIEIMSILRVEQESLISYEAKDDQNVTSTENQSNYDADYQTLYKTTTEICLPDDDDLIKTNDLLLLDPIFEYNLPDEDSLISVHDLVNPFGKTDQDNLHHYKQQYCQEPFQFTQQQQQHRMNSQGSNSSFMNEMVNRSSNYYYTTNSNSNKISSITRRQDLLAARFYQESLQTTTLPYGFYQESYGVNHLTNPSYPYQIYPSNNPNRRSFNTSYMDHGAGFERQSRASFVGYARK